MERIERRPSSFLTTMVRINLFSIIIIYHAEGKLMITEGGGWGDAVLPLVSPNGTAGEWFEDPYGTLGYTFSGPGELLFLLIKQLGSIY